MGHTPVTWVIHRLLPAGTNPQVWILSIQIQLSRRTHSRSDTSDTRCLGTNKPMKGTFFSALLWQLFPMVRCATLLGPVSHARPLHKGYCCCHRTCPVPISCEPAFLKTSLPNTVFNPQTCGWTSNPSRTPRLPARKIGLMVRNHMEPASDSFQTGKPSLTHNPYTYTYVRI